jgi:hypothetical protein
MVLGRERPLGRVKASRRRSDGMRSFLDSMAVDIKGFFWRS